MPDPRFPISITPQVYTRAKQYLTKIGFTGICALACDDTKLLPSLWPHYDQVRDVWMLVRGAGEPVEVRDKDTLQRVLEDQEIIKATKVWLSQYRKSLTSHYAVTIKIWLWMLQAQVPGVPPLVLCAKALCQGTSETKNMLRPSTHGALMYLQNGHSRG